MKRKSAEGLTETEIRPSLRAVEAQVRAATLDAVAGVRAEYERHLPTAQAQYVAATAKPFTGDVNVMFHNVEAGVRAVTAAHAQLLADGVPVDWDTVNSLAGVALALCYAQGQVTVAETGSDLPSLFAQAAELRDIMLTAAQSLVAVNRIPAAEVATIREGSGRRAQVDDLVELATLFRKYEAKARGVCTVTAQHVVDAEELHEEITRKMVPAGTRISQRKSPELVAATQARAALAALLARRMEYLERVGGWLWGASLREHVPSLHARRATRARKAAATPAPVKPANDTATAEKKTA